jgi:hypothetical protein
MRTVPRSQLHSPRRRSLDGFTNRDATSRTCLALTTPGGPIRHSAKLTFPVEPTRQHRETGEAFSYPHLWSGATQVTGLGSQFLGGGLPQVQHYMRSALLPFLAAWAWPQPCSSHAKMAPQLAGTEVIMPRARRAQDRRAPRSLGGSDGHRCGQQSSDAVGQ